MGIQREKGEGLHAGALIRAEGRRRNHGFHGAECAIRGLRLLAVVVPPPDLIQDALEGLHAEGILDLVEMFSDRIENGLEGVFFFFFGRHIQSPGENFSCFEESSDGLSESLPLFLNTRHLD